MKRIYLIVLTVGLLISLRGAEAVPSAGWRTVTHGPWLLNADCGRISIGLATKEAAGAAVDYRLQGTAKWRRQWAELGGQARLNRSTQIIHLEDLEEGREYEYRVVLANPENAVKDQLIVQKLYHFRTFSRKDETTRYMIVSDTQSSQQRRDRMWRNFYRNPVFASSEFCMHLGDIGLDMPDFRKEFLTGNVRLFRTYCPKEIPFMVARGNHEWRRAQANAFVELLEHPDLQTFYSFRKGPDYFIVLDSGEDRSDDSFSFDNVYASGRLFRRQRRWLEQVVRSEDFRRARYRIVFVHCGPYMLSEGFMTSRMRELTDDLFNGREKHNRIHMMYCGHDHLYMRSVPGQKKIITYQGRKGFYAYERLSGQNYSYVIAANDGPGYGGIDYSAGFIELSPRGIESKFFAEDGALIDHFQVSPEGNTVNMLKNQECYNGL